MLACAVACNSICPAPAGSMLPQLPNSNASPKLEPPSDTVIQRVIVSSPNQVRLKSRPICFLLRCLCGDDFPMQKAGRVNTAGPDQSLPSAHADPWLEANAHHILHRRTLGT